MLNLKVEGARDAQIFGRPKGLTPDSAPTVNEGPLSQTVSSPKNPMDLFLQVHSQPKGDREENLILDIRPQQQYLP